MYFAEAYEKMKRGDRIRRKTWETGVYLEEREGRIYQINDFENVALKDGDYLVMLSITEAKATDWEVLRDLTFGEAIEKAKEGCLIARRGWNEKGMVVAYRNGYDDIPCNRPHSEAWGIPVGESIKVRPYLQMRCADGYYQMWTASQSDILTDDWYIVALKIGGFAF